MAQKEEVIFQVKFSNEDMNDLIMGRIEIYATTAKAAIKKVSSMVYLPGGTYFLAEMKSKQSQEA